MREHFSRGEREMALPRSLLARTRRRCANRCTRRSLVSLRYPAGVALLLFAGSRPRGRGVRVDGTRVARHRASRQDDRPGRGARRLVLLRRRLRGSRAGSGVRRGRAGVDDRRDARAACLRRDWLRGRALGRSREAEREPRHDVRRARAAPPGGGPAPRWEKQKRIVRRLAPPKARRRTVVPGTLPPASCTVPVCSAAMTGRATPPSRRAGGASGWRCCSRSRAPAARRSSTPMLPKSTAESRSGRVGAPVARAAPAGTQVRAGWRGPGQPAPGGATRAPARLAWRERAGGRVQLAAQDLPAARWGLLA